MTWRWVGLVAAVMMLATAPTGLKVATAAPGPAGPTAPTSAAPAPKPAAPNPAVPNAADAGYKLGPDDALNIKVDNFPDMSTQGIVSADGKISVDLLGPVTVAGMTTPEVQQMLTRMWKKFVVDPHVLVTVTQRRPQTVTIAGPGSRPGAIDVRNGMHIIDALATAAAPNADLSQVVVTHQDGRRMTLDLRHPETLIGSPENILLADGDTIFIPNSHAQFSVLGEVAKPGSYDYQDKMTVLDALTQVGGLKDTADLEHASLVRDGKEAPLNLKALMQDHDLSVNIKLIPGDAIFVPPLKHDQFTVLGAIARPGNFDYHPDMTLLDAINEVGGLSDTADLDHATLTRDGTVTPLHLKALLKDRDLSANVKLAPGDAISIPTQTSQFGVFGEVTKPGSFEYQDNTTVLSAISAAGGLTAAADLDNSFLVHDGVTQKLDLKGLLQEGKLALNVHLQPGDSITIPERHGVVTVLGAVKTPGNIPYRDDMTLLDAVTASGGVADDANLSSASLLHDGKETSVDLAALLRRGDLSKNVTLSPGDRLMVPGLGVRRNYIFGAIAHPGYFLLKPGDRLLDVVDANGGTLKDANLSAVNVIHIDDSGNTAAVSHANISKFLTKGDMSGNIPVLPGDVIYIPEKGHGISIGDVFSVISGVSLAYSLAHVIGGGNF